MRGTRFGGVVAAGVLACALASGPGAVAAGGATTAGLSEDELLPSVVPTTGSLLPSIVPTTGSLLPGEDTIAEPVTGVLNPATSGGGSQPSPATNGGSTPPLGSGDGASTKSPSGTSRTPSRPTEGAGTESRPDGATSVHGMTAEPVGSPSRTLTGSAGTLASNIGRLAKPLGVPLGLALMVAIFMLIATRRPVALTKLDEERLWRHEGRSDGR